MVELEKRKVEREKKRVEGRIRVERRKGLKGSRKMAERK